MRQIMQILLTRGLGLLLLSLLISPFLLSIPPLQAQAHPGLQSPAGQRVYIPLMFARYNPKDGRRTINIPYFNVASVTKERFSEMAIFWFGYLSSSSNSADVRIGYNNTDLYIRTAAFDRYLWYDETPSSTDLTHWDAVTILLNLDQKKVHLPTPNTYRFDAQLNFWEKPRTPWQAAYRGTGGGWQSFDGTFETTSGWRGNSPNNNTDNDRGWTMTLRIPFATLGLPGRPGDGTVWQLAVILHDRDSASGPPLADQPWPEDIDGNTPSTWGLLRFGLPGYSPPPANPGGEVVIRDRLNGASVADAAVGGSIGNLCPGNPAYIWSETGWVAANFAGAVDFNLQNQADVADWPCFARYYITFPLNQIPAGKVILSAQLKLHEWGGSDPTQAKPSLIQVFTIQEDWDESTLTWNNSPLAQENVSQTWVEPIRGSMHWPGVPYVWDVSRAVAEAYQKGLPLRLAFYEADEAYHSGKYFTTSDAEDWDKEGRPTLTVVWGEPANP